MTIFTQSLDRAAFFLTFGAAMVEIREKYPENVFVLDVPPWLSFYESVGGWVPYNAFCNKRKDIKYKTRKMAGLPEHFTGDKKTRIKLGDIAVIKPWRKGEAGWQPN